jgi:type VI secretion system secreted protein Hcp
MKSILGRLFGALWLAAVLVPLPARAALDMFLDIPGVTGESTRSGHTNQMDVLAWSWGMSNSGTTHNGGTTNTVKADFQDLSVTKYVDNASTQLLLHCANGSHFATATLYVNKTGTNYLKITLTEVLVVSVSTGGSGGEDRLTENITLNFAKVQFDYTPTTPPGPVVSFGWDIVASAAFP